MLTRTVMPALALSLSIPALAAPSDTPAESDSQETDLRYEGFGGVAAGYNSFYSFQLIGNKVVPIDTRGLYSYYFARVGEGGWYAGFAIGANYYSDSYTLSGPDNLFYNYYDGVEQFAGSVSVSESFFHVPIETNVAWAARPWKKAMFWVGGGFSIHTVSYFYEERQSALAYDTVAEEWFFWEDSFREGGDSGRSIQPGVQLLGGVEYIFGKIPRIGGEWGLSLQARYQKVRMFVLKNKGGVNYSESYLDGVDYGGNDIDIKWGGFEGFDASNASVALGLSYHY